MSVVKAAMRAVAKNKGTTSPSTTDMAVSAAIEAWWENESDQRPVKDVVKSVHKVVDLQGQPIQTSPKSDLDVIMEDLLEVLILAEGKVKKNESAFRRLVSQVSPEDLKDLKEIAKSILAKKGEVTAAATPVAAVTAAAVPAVDLTAPVVSEGDRPRFTPPAEDVTAR